MSELRLCPISLNVAGPLTNGGAVITYVPCMLSKFQLWCFELLVLLSEQPALLGQSSTAWLQWSGMETGTTADTNVEA